MGLLYGLDPEVFVSYKDDSKDYVLSLGMMEEMKIIKPVIKDKKHPYYIKNDDFGWQMDGCAAEVTFYQPFKDYKEMYQMVNLAYEALDIYISKLNWDGRKLSVYKKPTININPELYLPFLPVSEKIYQGFIFGCDRDYDAIETNYNCKTIEQNTYPYRHGGGHIHISGDYRIYHNVLQIVKLLAITVGNFCTANSLFPTEDKLRIESYGKPGRYRRQEYNNNKEYRYRCGVEYRSPSNSWTTLPIEKYEELIYWINKAHQYFIKLYTDSNFYGTIKEFLPPTIESMLSFNQESSKEILSQLP